MNEERDFVPQDDHTSLELRNRSQIMEGGFAPSMNKEKLPMQKPPHDPAVTGFSIRFRSGFDRVHMFDPRDDR